MVNEKARLVKEILELTEDATMTYTRSELVKLNEAQLLLLKLQLESEVKFEDSDQAAV